MKLTVVICTWNRAHLLDQALDSMSRMTVPPATQWQLIVVNNNCTDSTSSVVQKYRDELPIEEVVELRQGISHARNAGLDHATSDWVLFTDDDVMVEPTWLEAYLSETAITSSGVAVLGGEISPRFVAPPDKDLVAAFPMVAQGFCERILPVQREISSATDYLPFGANFAIRKSALGSIRFDTQLGVVGHRRMLGEEVALIELLLEKGLTGRWIENAMVRHYVDPKRLTLPALRRQLYGMGRSSIRSGTRLDGRWRIATLPLWVFRETAESLPAALVPSAMYSDPIQYYVAFGKFWMRMGMIVEAFTGRAK